MVLLYYAIQEGILVKIVRLSDRRINTSLPGTIMVGFWDSTQLYDPMYFRSLTLISSASAHAAGFSIVWTGDGNKPSSMSRSAGRFGTSKGITPAVFLVWGFWYMGEVIFLRRRRDSPEFLASEDNVWTPGRFLGCKSKALQKKHTEFHMYTNKKIIALG